MHRKECQAQVKDYPGAVFKGFESHSEADLFVDGRTMGARVSRSGQSSSYVSRVRETYSGDFVGGANR